MRLRFGETKGDWIEPHFHLTQDPAHFIPRRLQPAFPMLAGGQSSRGCMEGVAGLEQCRLGACPPRLPLSPYE